MTQRIISGYSDDAGGRDALALGVVLADLAGDAELTVARAYSYNPPTAIGSPASGWRLTLRDRAEAELRPARAAFGTRPRTSFVACCGVSPTDGLHRLADELAATAIVVGGSHDHGLGRVRVGGVTEQTLHGAPCAVAVAAAGYADRAGARIGRVAVAFNGSAESRRALAAGTQIARDAGARLTILGAVGEAAVWYGAYAGDDAATVRGVVRDELDAAAAGLTGLSDVRVEVLGGDPAGAIAEASAGEDLLVLGSRGYGPLRRVLLGSVSSRLVRDAACGVLVVPRTAVRAPGDEAAASEPAAATA
ncbi:universal stress protein [Patulibacter sp. NPDC049589]|uniref:universal stress protein n=1 Tax=Patulibacter sp. NPDC049589 TaxID=3154731 RepID=UPI003412E96D